MAEAIVMDGGRRGQTVKVCADPNCRVHHPSTPSPQQVARQRAEERKRIEKEKLAITVRHRVLATILQRVSAPLKKADLLTVAHYLISRLSYHQIPGCGEAARFDRIRWQGLVQGGVVSRSDFDSREAEALADAQQLEGDRAVVAAMEQRIAQARSLVAQRQAQVESARSAPQQLREAQAKSESSGSSEGRRAHSGIEPWLH
jgi:hypothetical protein